MLFPLQLLDTSTFGLMCGFVLLSVFLVLRSYKTDTCPKEVRPVSYLSSWNPLLGNTFELANNVDRYHDWVAEQSLKRDGKPFALRLPGKNDLMFISRPEDFEEVLKTQSRNFIKSDTVREIFDDFLGEDIVLLNGERWQFHRKILAGLITTRALRECMTPIVQENVLQLQKVLSETKKPFDASKLMRQFTLNTFSEIGFGCKLNLLASGKEHPFEVAFDDANRISSERLTVPEWVWKLQRWLNVGSERRLREAIGEMNEFILKLIANTIERAKAEDQPTKNDILSIIVRRMKTSEEEITATMVRDISLTGLEAGRNTTADALSWLFHALSHNQHVEKKLRAEIAEKLPKFTGSDSYVPSYEDIQDLPYLDATIREVLRLYPTVPVIPYHCVRDTVLADNMFIRAGTDVFLSLYAAGHLTSVWGEDATKFSPERFINEKTGELLKDSLPTYSAFSGGPRVCVGRNLAMLELKIVVATILSRFKLIEEPGQDVRAILELTLGMKNPLMMRVEPANHEIAASY